RWRPPFVSKLAAEDRCHLNGMTLVSGEPRYVTALGQSDTPGGWRENKVSGGCLIDVESGEIVTAELCMPHSPRFHNDKLWFLNSGLGEVGTVNLHSGVATPLTRLLGYTRGLSICEGYAVVGLSKIREASTFGGLPISQGPEKLACGVYVIELTTGRTIATLEFTDGVEEIYDIQFLPQIRYPAVLGFQKDTINNAFILPDGTDY